MWILLSHFPDEIVAQVLGNLHWTEIVRLIVAWPSKELDSGRRLAIGLVKVDFPEELECNQIFNKWLWGKSFKVRRLTVNTQWRLIDCRLPAASNLVDSVKLKFFSEDLEKRQKEANLCTFFASLIWREKVISIDAQHVMNFDTTMWQACRQFDSRLEEFKIRIKTHQMAVQIKEMLIHCPNLRSLTLNFLRAFNAGLLAVVFDLPESLQLTTLNICTEEANSADIDTLARMCPKLVHLGITMDNYYDCIATTLSLGAIALHCAQLRTLYINPGSKTTILPDSLLLVVRLCSKLQNLHMENVPFTDELLMAMAGSTLYLTTLAMVWSVEHMATVLSAKTLLGGLDSFTVLSRAGNYPIARHHHTLDAALTYTTNLRVFDNLHCEVNNSIVCNSISTQCRTLQVLRISLPNTIYYGDVYGNLLVQVAQKNPQLKELCVRGDYCVPQHYVVLALPLLSKLQTLDLDVDDAEQRKMKLSQTTVLAIAQYCPDIERVKNPCSADVTDAAVLTLAQHARRLQSIDFYFSTAVSEQALLLLAQSCRHLQVVVVPSTIHFAGMNRLSEASKLVPRPPWCPNICWM